MSPSSKEYLGRSPEGTAKLAGSTGKHIALCGPAWERPGARPAEFMRHETCQ